MDTRKITVHNLDIASHKAYFESFVNQYITVDSHYLLKLKYEHTQHVLDNVKMILQYEEFSNIVSRGALLAALYHDIGRFPQFIKWRTFNDWESINHATLSVQILKKYGFLEEEIKIIQKVCLSAIVLHNRKLLPKQLDNKIQLTATILRDADKLDILRVVSSHMDGTSQKKEVTLFFKDEPLKWNHKVMQDILEGRTPSYLDLIYLNDFKMVILSWIRELTFPITKRLFASSSSISVLLDTLPNCNTFQNIRNLFTKMIEESL